MPYAHQWRQSWVAAGEVGGLAAVVAFGVGELVSQVESWGNFDGDAG
jgi:hypothetical protein